ncbi:hypothetical protein HYPSUDRAFT_198414 [Hypholoma sublateritium FD-334 SS-4]|uniref:Mitochondrial splicing suppressor 51-like C-terminal domain-containing protein n=1 Tax=Hypholoma sublateritium (strain FD-334 SS-4) TaxID=945553 RepID=A0A0D2Q6A0_HYPSF|nr:hypothetical protein HYPSUDRAFT_198414 [Hypholoma sublateritium FD-334 SS-4]
MPANYLAAEAPPECGSGAISIHLNSASENWSATNSDLPDALVACNASLGSYREWFPVIQAAHLKRIPFATTEYAEQSAEHQRNMMPIILSGSGVSPCPVEEFKIQLNPFQRPGQRPIPMYRLPNVVNGFTLIVYKNKKSKTKDVKTRKDIGDVEKTLRNLTLNQVD